ncbi:MAG: glycosyltransferase family 4 protein [Roseovarius sp.]
MTARGRVVLFYDVPDWAFHNVARNVARQMRDWNVELLGRDDWFGRAQVVERVALEADILVFLWRFDLLAFLDCLGPRAWRRFTGPGRPALVSVVYDHIYADAAALAELGNPFALSDVVAASSERLKALYTAAPDLPDIALTLPDGVDTALFSPSATAPEGQPIRIGWVGNSQWAGTLQPDLKGRHRVFGPAIAQLRAAGHDVEACVADAAERRLPRAEMPGFYRGLDLMMCTSAMEGTPNPVLEAMATGTPVISTDVGIVPEVFGPKQRAFILKERTPEAFAKAADRLIGDPALRAALRAENLARRDRLDWAGRAALWEALFETALAARGAQRGQDTGAALAAHRSRARSALQHARRLVATNAVAYRTYSHLLRRYPGLIRNTRRLLAKGA